jgi:hypothetical protein
MTGDGSTIYAATDNNGLWASVNSGVTWNQIYTIPSCKFVRCNLLDGTRVAPHYHVGYLHFDQWGQAVFSEGHGALFSNPTVEFGGAHLEWYGGIRMR